MRSDPFLIVLRKFYNFCTATIHFFTQLAFREEKKIVGRGMMMVMMIMMMMMMVMMMVKMMMKMVMTVLVLIK